MPNRIGSTTVQARLICHFHNMRQSFYFLSFAIAVTFIFNSAILSVAPQLYQRRKSGEPPRRRVYEVLPSDSLVLKDIPLQHRLNAKLKSGWTGTRESFVDYIKDELHIVRIVILLPRGMTSEQEKKHAASIKAIDWKGIDVHARHANRWIPLLLNTKKLTLVIGSDVELLRSKCHMSKPHCVAAFSAGLFPIVSCKFPSIQQLHIN